MVNLGFSASCTYHVTRTETHREFVYHYTPYHHTTTRLVTTSYKEPHSDNRKWKLKQASPATLETFSKSLVVKTPGEAKLDGKRLSKSCYASSINHYKPEADASSEDDCSVKQNYIEDGAEVTIIGELVKKKSGQLEIGPPKDGKPFVITTKKVDDYIKARKEKSFSYVVGAVALAAIAGAICLFRNWR